MITGNAQTGTWRSDWEMALTELRRLAIRGPPSTVVVGLMYVWSSMLQGQLAASGYLDSSELIDIMLGDMVCACIGVVRVRACVSARSRARGVV